MLCKWCGLITVQGCSDGQQQISSSNWARLTPMMGPMPRAASGWTCVVRLAPSWEYWEYSVGLRTTPTWGTHVHNNVSNVASTWLTSSCTTQFNSYWLMMSIPSVLWHCWLGGRKGVRPVKNWVVGTGMVICLEWGADLHTAQLMPLPLTVSCFSKIQIGFIFLVLAYPGSPGQRAVKRVCVCVLAEVLRDLPLTWWWRRDNWWSELTEHSAQDLSHSCV